MPDNISGDNWEVGKSLRFLEELTLSLTIILESTHNVGSIGKNLNYKGMSEGKT